MTVELEGLSVDELESLIQNIGGYDLEPISPEKAVELYLNDRKEELAKASLDAHRSALRFFQRFCEKEGIDNLNELTGRQLHQYRVWRRDEATEKVDSLSKKSEKTQQDILREFIKKCEAIDAVKPGLHKKVQSPSVKPEEASRSEELKPERAEEILEWLRKYEYATVEHVVWILFTEWGPRTGTIYAIDVDDFYPNAETPHIKIRHRPETDTPLKNGENGERTVWLSDRACTIISDYLEEQRPDVTDEYGREPLLTAGYGRLAKTTIRKYVYKWTRPCAIGKACPKGRDLEECEATIADAASKCPSSQSAHTVRRGYITHELSSGVDRSYVCGRCNVSEEVIETHYDERGEKERMQVRRRAFEDVRRNQGSYGGE